MLVPLILATVLNWTYLNHIHFDSTINSKSNTELKAILSWNQTIMDLAKKEDGLLTLKGVRTEAMCYVAIHDVLNTVKPVYTRYAYLEVSESDTDPIVAAHYAAFEIIRDQYPQHEKHLQNQLNEYLTHSLSDVKVSSSQKLGKRVARQILDERRDDGWNNEAEYTWHPMAPGVYAEFNEHSGTPEGFVFGAGWAKAKPFLLTSPDQFRSPPPPKIKSQAYLEAFNEVKSLGSENSTTRTTDQAHYAMWWKEFVESSHNQLACQLITLLDLDIWEAVRALALLNMTICDAYINVFDNKFHFNHWRPYTAIRWADHDGNPNTIADTTWNNLHNHTYAFPSYPSAHGTASSAAMRVLSHVLGAGDQYDFTMRIDSVDSAGPFSPKIAMHPPTRSFHSFSQAGMEASMSRVYLGIHFRYDSEEGHRLGNQIGDFAIEQYLNAH